MVQNWWKLVRNQPKGLKILQKWFSVKCSTLGDTPEKSIGQSQMISVEPSDGWEIPRLQQRYRPIAALLLFFTAKQCEVLFVLQMPMIWSLEKFLIQPYMICHCSTKASFSHHGNLQMRFLVNNSIFKSTWASFSFWFFSSFVHF